MRRAVLGKQTRKYAIDILKPQLSAPPDQLVEELAAQIYTAQCIECKFYFKLGFASGRAIEREVPEELQQTIRSPSITESVPLSGTSTLDASGFRTARERDAVIALIDSNLHVTHILFYHLSHRLVYRFDRYHSAFLIPFQQEQYNYPHIVFFMLES